MAENPGRPITRHVKLPRAVDDALIELSNKTDTPINALLKLAVAKMVQQPGEIRRTPRSHGTLTSYALGCRCVKCRVTKRNYDRQRRINRRSRTISGAQIETDTGKSS